MLHIPIILGTARKGRRSEKVARFVLEELAKFGKEKGFVTELIDIRDFPLSATDNTQTSSTAKKFAEKISTADGLVMVAPEYNHGYPGELKLVIDMLYEQYAYKPIGFCGVSIGPWGGNRVVEQLRQIAIELHMIPIREALYFPLVENLFDEKGKIKDASSYQNRIKAFLDEMEWYAETLKIAREKNKASP